MKREQFWRQTMMNGGNPSGVRQRMSLCVGNRHDRHVLELTIHRLEFFYVQSPVQRRDMRNRWQPAHDGKVKLRNVEMNDVKLIRKSSNLFEHEDVRSNQVTARASQAECLRTYRDQSGRSTRVTAGEEGDLMTKPHEFVTQIRKAIQDTAPAFAGVNLTKLGPTGARAGAPLAAR